MNVIEKKINFFFNHKICFIILLLTSLTVIIVSSQLYDYELALLQKDASSYILLAEDPAQYLIAQHQDALRILPSLLVFLLKIIGLSTESGFKFLTYISFIYLNIKTFYFLRSYKIENYLCLSAVAILFYSNHSIIYIVFNFYQLVDLLTYILIIHFFQLYKSHNIKKLFFISLLAIFTKEYLLILVLTIHINYFLLFKKKDIFKSLFVILLIFLIHYKFASINNLDPGSKESLFYLIKSYFVDYKLYFNAIFECLFKAKNILLFFPFVLLFFSRKFLNFLFEHWSIILFSLVPISFSIIMFHLVGNNFFRIFYQGYFLIILLGLLFIFKKISLDLNSKTLIFISPTFYLIDFIYIFFNINQDGFFDYFQFVRYEYLSGYYIYNLTIILLLIINSKKIFLKN